MNSNLATVASLLHRTEDVILGATAVYKRVPFKAVRYQLLRYFYVPWCLAEALRRGRTERDHPIGRHLPASLNN